MDSLASMMSGREGKKAYTTEWVQMINRTLAFLIEEGFEIDK